MSGTRSAPTHRRCYAARNSRTASSHSKRYSSCLRASPRGDRNLVHWHAWAKGRLDPAWLATLDASAGGPALARTWFLYWGVIPPHWIVEARHLRSGMDVPWPAARRPAGR